jgi:hypothetical protein
MMKIPAGKTVYIKSRKYVEGEELPGGVFIDFDEKPVKKSYDKKDAFALAGDNDGGSE